MSVDVRVAAGHLVQVEEGTFMTVQELNDGLEVSKLHGQDSMLLQNADLNVAIPPAFCQPLMPNSDAIFLRFALMHNLGAFVGKHALHDAAEALNISNELVQFHSANGAVDAVVSGHL